MKWILSVTKVCRELSEKRFVLGYSVDGGISVYDCERVTNYAVLNLE